MSVSVRVITDDPEEPGRSMLFTIVPRAGEVVVMNRVDPRLNKTTTVTYEVSEVVHYASIEAWDSPIVTLHLKERSS